MAVEVKQQLERARVRGDRRRGKSARSDVERDVPPMVDERREDHANLPDNLGPSVQRLASVAPRGKWQVGPGGVCSHARKLTPKQTFGAIPIERGEHIQGLLGRLTRAAVKKLNGRRHNSLAVRPPTSRRPVMREPETNDGRPSLQSSGCFTEH